MIAKIRWKYVDAAKQSDTVFYWIDGGTYLWEKTYYERGIGMDFHFVRDPRVQLSEDGGVVDQIEFEGTVSRCSKCNKRTYERLEKANFVVYTDLNESFLCTEDSIRNYVCHASVLETIRKHSFSGSRVLSQNPIEPRHCKTNRIPTDLGDAFGNYFVLSAEQELPEARIVFDKKCPKCEAPDSFRCSECCQLFPACNRCALSCKFEKADSRTPITVDLREWNGDDIVDSKYCVLVSGRVVQALIDDGHTCFAFGRVNCVLDGLSPKLLDRAIAISHAPVY